MNTESKTPRTDDQAVRYYDDATGTRIEYVAARFARQLERELIQRERERDELRSAIRNLRAVKGRFHTEQAATKLFNLLP